MDLFERISTSFMKERLISLCNKDNTARRYIGCSIIHDFNLVKESPIFDVRNSGREDEQ